MTSRRAWMIGVVGIVAVAPAAWAQFPAPPVAGGGIPVAPAGLGGVPALAPAAAAPRTLWSFFGLTHQNLEACKLKICRSPLGSALGGFASGPVAGLTGGLFSGCCPPPTNAEIAALAAKGGPQGAEAVAAKIKQDEADAKARVAAVEYLGTVDCRYWKEAQVALLNALRADRNECVRFAAAKALNSGCCCSKEVIETLRIVVACEDSDGFPAEPSPRVKGAAFAALQNCLMRVPEELPPEVVPLEPERGPLPPGAPAPLEPEVGSAAPYPAGAVQLASAPYGTPATVTPRRPTDFDARLRRKTFGQSVDEARRTLFELAQAPSAAPDGLPPGRRSVVDALTKARQDVSEATQADPARPLVPMPRPMSPEVAPAAYVPAQPVAALPHPPLPVRSLPPVVAPRPRPVPVPVPTPARPAARAVAPPPRTLAPEVAPAAFRPSFRKTDAPVKAASLQPEPAKKPQASKAGATETESNPISKRGLIGHLFPSRSGKTRP